MEGACQKAGGGRKQQTSREVSVFVNDAKFWLKLYACAAERSGKEKGRG